MKFLFPCQIYFLGFRGGHRNHQRPQITVLFPPSNRRTATTATARGRHAAVKEDFFHNFFTQFLLTPSVIDFPIDRFSIIHRRNFQPFDLGTVHQGFVNVGRDICFFIRSAPQWSRVTFYAPLSCGRKRSAAGYEMENNSIVVKNAPADTLLVRGQG